MIAPMEVLTWLCIEPAGWRVPWPTGLTLLEAAQQHGIRLPRSCRNGTCRACLCQRTAGATRHRIAWPGLSAEEREAGWILPCVAEAEGPGEVAIYQPGAQRGVPFTNTRSSPGANAVQGS